MKFKYIPNIITVLRLLLIVPFAMYLYAGEYRVAFIIYFFAGASDVIDGFLARHFDWSTELGGFLDPLADKILLMAGFLALVFLDQIGWWLVILVITRDVVIMSGVAGLHYLFGHVDFRPSFISKLNTVFQVFLVLSLLFGMAFWPMPEKLVQSLIILVAATTIASFINYVWVWGRHAYYGKPC